MKIYATFSSTFSTFSTFKKGGAKSLEKAFENSGAKTLYNEVKNSGEKSLEKEPIDFFSKTSELSNYIMTSKKQWEIFSKDGLFQVENSDIYQLNVTNEKQEEIEYGSYYFLIDYSKITREKVAAVPSDHISHFIHYHIYQIEPKIKLVMKYLVLDDQTKYPLDAYFEVDDTKNSWLLEEISAFLFTFFTKV
jgi:hypothetical protein